VAAVEGNTARGAFGERIAALYLQLAGCTILERNVRFDHVEIDLVVRDGPCIAFVEVKTRCGRGFGGACEAVGPEKMRNLRRAARWYLYRELPAGPVEEYRFDLVSLDCNLARGMMELSHIKGIG